MAEGGREWHREGSGTRISEDQRSRRQRRGKRDGTAASSRNGESQRDGHRRTGLQAHVRRAAGAGKRRESHGAPESDGRPGEHRSKRERQTARGRLGRLGRFADGGRHEDRAAVAAPAGADSRGRHRIRDLASLSRELTGERLRFRAAKRGRRAECALRHRASAARADRVAHAARPRLPSRKARSKARATFAERPKARCLEMPH
jgi:hypothetical protein